MEVAVLMALDYASIMAAGQSLVPDLQEQTYRRELNQSLIDQRRAQTQMRADQAERERQFRADVAAATESGEPRAIHGLMIKYPEFADKIKPGWQAMDNERKQRTMTQMGSIYVRAKNNDFAGAAKLLDARIAADKAAGLDTSDDEQIRDALLSGDPDQQKIALGTIGVTLSAADPDKFGDTFGKFNPTEAKTEVQKGYEWRLANFGKEFADNWLAGQDTEVVSVVPGGSVYNKADFANPPRGGIMGNSPSGDLPGTATGPDGERRFTTPAPQPRGGDPVRLGGGGIESLAKQTVPGINVTSRTRSPAKNAAVGGKPDSYHLTGQARDFTPPAGMNMAQLHAQLARAFPGYDVINEGDHVHVEPGPRMARTAQAGPKRIRSKQEYDRLPSGTEFIAPDGSHRRKP